MIKNMDFKNPAIDVHMKDGRWFTNKDIPYTVISEANLLVYFWNDEKTMMAIPMSEVERIDFHEKTE